MGPPAIHNKAGKGLTNAQREREAERRNKKDLEDAISIIVKLNKDLALLNDRSKKDVSGSGSGSKEELKGLSRDLKIEQRKVINYEEELIVPHNLKIKLRIELDSLLPKLNSQLVDSTKSSNLFQPFVLEELELSTIKLTSMTNSAKGAEDKLADIKSKFKKLEWTVLDKLPKDISSSKTTIKNNSTRLIPQLKSSIEHVKNLEASIPTWKESIKEALLLRDSAAKESASIQHAIVRVRGSLGNESTLKKRIQYLDEYIYAFTRSLLAAKVSLQETQGKIIESTTSQTQSSQKLEDELQLAALNEQLKLESLEEEYESLTTSVHNHTLHLNAIKPSYEEIELVWEKINSTKLILKGSRSETVILEAKLLKIDGRIEHSIMMKKEVRKREELRSRYELELTREKEVVKISRLEILRLEKALNVKESSRKRRIESRSKILYLDPPLPPLALSTKSNERNANLLITKLATHLSSLSNEITNLRDENTDLMMRLIEC